MVEREKYFEQGRRPRRRGSVDIRHAQPCPKRGDVTRDRRLRIAALVALGAFLVTLLGSLLYARSLPSEYTGTAVVQFSPRPTKNGGVVGGETVASTAAGYVAYMGAPATLQAVSDQIGIEPATLKDGLTVTLLPTTTTVTVDYTGADPQVAAQGANAMAAAAVARAKADTLVTASELARAAEPNNPSGPQRLAIAAAGVVLAGLLAVLVLVVMVVIPSRRRAITEWLDPETGPDDNASDAGSAHTAAGDQALSPPRTEPVNHV